MNTMTTEGGRQRQRRNKPITVYGRFLKWVGFHYNLTQKQLADIMGVTQSTISNWQIGEYEASWRANRRMADELHFDTQLRHLLAVLLTYGQEMPAPATDPPNFPYSLASCVITDENLEQIAKAQQDWESRHEKEQGDNTNDATNRESRAR